MYVRCIFGIHLHANTISMNNDNKRKEKQIQFLRIFIYSKQEIIF